MQERRGAFRYDLSLPIVVRGVPGLNEPEPLFGRTSNISTRGIYFTIDRAVAPGTKLHISVTLPREVSEETRVSIDAEVRVMRAEEAQEASVERVTIAARIEEYSIVRAEFAAS